MSVLTDIQNELKVPKKRKNSFGGYNYRSCEDILEAVKPLLKKYESTLIISDTIKEIGGRVYVEATARLLGRLNPAREEYSVTAYAREAELKKGMDDSQITGTASSYARKYALNGLFLIDDSKDADTDEYADEAENMRMIAEIGEKKIGKVRAAALEEQLKNAGEKGVNIPTLLSRLHLESLEDMTEEQHAAIIRQLGGRK